MTTTQPLASELDTLDDTTSYHVDFTPDPALYPFMSRWFESSVGRVHYIDEGEGPAAAADARQPRLELSLSQDDPHPDAATSAASPSTTPASVCRFTRPTTATSRAITPRSSRSWSTTSICKMPCWSVRTGVVPSGSTSHPGCPSVFTGLVAGNTMMWSAAPFRMQSTFSRLMGFDWVQKSLVKRHTFVKRVMPALLQDAPTDAEMRHYLDVAPTPHARKGHAIFPKAIVGETAWLEALEQRVRTNLADRPMLRIMGMKDVPLTTKAYMRKWDDMWPNATKLDLPHAGHFWQEDEPVVAAEAIIAAYAN